MENMDIILWAVVMALALVGEMLIPLSFFLVFFALGGAVALVMALLGAGSVAEVLGFVAASLVGMVVLRPALLERISLQSGERYLGHRGITGRSATVTEAIEPDASGMVQIGKGEFWTARALYSGERIGKGERVKVLDMDGLTALVEPVERKGE